MQPRLMRTAVLSALLVILNHTNTLLAQTAPKQLCGQVQTLVGSNEDVIKIPGATLQWLNSDLRVVSNPYGEFCINLNGKDSMLIVSAKGFVQDTIAVQSVAGYVKITLTKKTKAVDNVVVTARKSSTSIDYLNAAQTLKIREGELLKAACCNLSESFETTPSVDVSFTDAITGQKQIQMLGLATPYTIIMQENIPNIRGLASTVGLNYTPGTFVQGMQLSKGTGSVVNGYESLAGQINVELQKPDDKTLAYFNMYQNSGGRAELNLNLNNKLNKTTAAGVMLHYKNQFASTDNNNDGFMDNPLGGQAIAVARAQYFDAKGWEVQGLAKVVKANENGGALAANGWLYKSEVERYEASLKIGKVWKHKPWKSIGWQHAGFLHTQHLSAGSRAYHGVQRNYYSNFIYQTIIGNTSHGIKWGASTIVEKYDEDIPDTTIIKQLRLDIVPGIYVEHSYNYLKTLTVVTGMRADYHSNFGWFATPRFHIRYTPIERTTLRASIGRAQRTVNMLAENMPVLFSNRELHFVGKKYDWRSGQQREIAWNTGASLVQDFILNYRKGTVMLDYYYSWFKNQWVADFESPRHVYFYALQGKSFAHSAQLQVDYEVLRKKMDIRFAIKYYNVQGNYRGSALSKPLFAAQRAFVNIAYHTRSKWSFDGTYFINGNKRLPNAYATSFDSNFAMKQSPVFSNINAHISKQVHKQWEIYAGGENITNYMQPNAIISSAATSNPDFDASQIWGPVMGVNVYAGVRWKKNRTEH